MFSLKPNELTNLGRELLCRRNQNEDQETPHLCIETLTFGRCDGRGLELSLIGFEEVKELKLRQELRTQNVCYWEVDPNAKVKADIIRPINILRLETENVETGLRTWPIAHFMAETLVRHPSMIPEGPVLELGSGLGMLGCVLRRALDWPHPVVLSDIQNEEFPHVLNFLKANANLNMSTGKPLIVEDLFWGASHVKPFKARLSQAHGIDIDALGGFSCIIGCDLVYHEFAPELLESIDLLLSHSPLAVAYITFPDRCKDSAERFTMKLESMDFHVKELSFVDRLQCTSSDTLTEVVKDIDAILLTDRSNQAQAVRNELERKRLLTKLVGKLGLHLLEIRRSSSMSRK